MTELDKPIKERRFHKAMLGLKEKNESLIKRVHKLQKGIDTLFDSIKHGDEKHRAWLKKAIEDHFKKEEE